jgi:hypothetical protein
MVDAKLASATHQATIQNLLLSRSFVLVAGGGFEPPTFGL